MVDPSPKDPDMVVLLRWCIPAQCGRELLLVDIGRIHAGEAAYDAPTLAIQKAWRASWHDALITSCWRRRWAHDSRTSAGTPRAHVQGCGNLYSRNIFYLAAVFARATGWPITWPVQFNGLHYPPLSYSRKGPAFKSHTVLLQLIRSISLTRFPYAFRRSPSRLQS